MRLTPTRPALLAAAVLVIAACGAAKPVSSTAPSVTASPTSTAVATAAPPSIEPTASPSASTSNLKGQIVFDDVGDNFQHTQIWIENADGSNVRKVVSDDATDSSASLSPDGHRVTFDRDSEDGIGRIMVVNVDGSGLHELDTGSRAKRCDAGVEGDSWSPDGNRLAFTRTCFANGDNVNGDFVGQGLWTINVDGTGLREVSHNAPAKRCPLRIPVSTWKTVGRAGHQTASDSCSSGSTRRRTPSGRRSSRSGSTFTEGRFFPDVADVPVSRARLVPAALAEIARGATWIKVVGDWLDPALSYPVDALRSLIEAVHEAGARVAVHTQWAGASAIVDAGPDSIEHGTMLDEPTMRKIAANNVAWTPTIAAAQFALAARTKDVAEFDPTTGVPGDLEFATRRKGDWEAYFQRLPTMLATAVAHGVTILAGPDAAAPLAHEVAPPREVRAVAEPRAPRCHNGRASVPRGPRTRGRRPGGSGYVRQGSAARPIGARSTRSDCPCRQADQIVDAATNATMDVIAAPDARLRAQRRRPHRVGGVSLALRSRTGR